MKLLIYMFHLHPGMRSASPTACSGRCPTGVLAGVGPSLRAEDASNLLVWHAAAGLGLLVVSHSGGGEGAGGGPMGGGGGPVGAGAGAGAGGAATCKTSLYNFQSPERTPLAPAHVHTCCQIPDADVSAADGSRSTTGTSASGSIARALYETKRGACQQGTGEACQRAATAHA